MRRYREGFRSGGVEERQPAQVQDKPLGLLIDGLCRVRQEPRNGETVQVPGYGEFANPAIESGLDRQSVRITAVPQSARVASPALCRSERRQLRTSSAEIIAGGAPLSTGLSFPGRALPAPSHTAHAARTDCVMQAGSERRLEEDCDRQGKRGDTQAAREQKAPGPGLLDKNS